MTTPSDTAPDAATDLPGMPPPAIEQVPPAPVPEPQEVTPDPEPPVETGEKSDLEKWLDAEAAYLKEKREITVEPDWAHETIEFDGDTLAIRVPNQSALTAFSLGTTEFSPAMTQQATTSMFVQMHLSPRSYRHVWMRLMSPDDTFSDETLGDLMRVLVEKSSEAIMAEIKAKEEAAKSG